MSSRRIITVFIVALLSFSTQAFETAVTPHAMLYVSIPLDGPGPDRDRVNYGFRLDSIAYTPGERIDYSRQLERTAVVDFRLDEHGVDGVYLSGIDYLQQYRVNRQNEEQGESVPAEDESTAAEAVAEEAAAEEEAEEDDGMTAGDHIRGVLADMRATAPMGIWMGIGLGVVLLLGVDD